VLYVGVPLFIADWENRFTYSVLLSLLFLAGFSLVLNSFTGSTVSLTAGFLEILLIMPFLFATFGVGIGRYVSAVGLIRMLNILACVLSSWHLVVNMGFPFRLPYIHYPPDHYFAAFGFGGAKIVTIIGFFGLAEGLTAMRRGQPRPHNLILLIAAVNFFVPSFILGIVVGCIALSLMLRRNAVLTVLLLIIILIITPYIVFRIQTVNSLFEVTFGSQPKIFAYVSLSAIFSQEPHAVFFGLGPGQFSSQPALWASPVAELVSRQSIPKLPGFFASDAHLKYLAPTLIHFVEDRHAIESSLNKPYTGFSVLAVEFGLVFTLIMVLSFGRIFWRSARSNLGRVVFLFVIGLNLLDPQFDVPWFGVMLMAVVSILAEERRQDARG
jgi:hypothetical protein